MKAINSLLKIFVLSFEFDVVLNKSVRFNFEIEKTVSYIFNVFLLEITLRLGLLLFQFTFFILLEKWINQGHLKFKIGLYFKKFMRFVF